MATATKVKPVVFHYQFPMEFQLAILEACVVSPTPLSNIHIKLDADILPSLNIMWTSKFNYHEGMKMFYSKNVFTLAYEPIQTIAPGLLLQKFLQQPIKWHDTEKPRQVLRLGLIKNITLEAPIIPPMGPPPYSLYIKNWICVRISGGTNWRHYRICHKIKRI
jgi:hypothetical protein